MVTVYVNEDGDVSIVSENIEPTVAARQARMAINEFFKTIPGEVIEDGEVHIQ